MELRSRRTSYCSTPPPCSLARYIATSACCSSSSRSAPCSGATATPTLARTSTSSPSSTMGTASSVSSRWAVRCGGARARAGQQDRELVAAEPGDGVDLAHGARQAAADQHEQAVADVVAEGVVDLLEAVEVEQQQRRTGAVPLPHLLERLGGALGEALAVGQAGERVGHGLALAVEGDRADPVDDDQGWQQQRQEVRPLLDGQHDQRREGEQRGVAHPLVGEVLAQQHPPGPADLERHDDHHEQLVRRRSTSGRRALPAAAARPRGPRATPPGGSRPAPSPSPPPTTTGCTG